MKITSWIPISLGVLLSVFIMSFASCNKEELHSIKGTVLDINNQPVVSARIQIFENPEDWLTGHNVLATLSSDLKGYFESRKIFESGEYYIFVEKHDTSNWNIREVEQGIYPKITVPLQEDTKQIVEQNSIQLLANTSWKLTNILREYTKTNQGAKEWHSNWTVSNNCEKDNTIHFGKDLSMRVSEGNYICSNNERNILGTFVPPMIFNTMGCERLLHTSQKVKPFEYDGWDQMKEKNGELFLACDQSVGQLYLIYDLSPNQKELRVYSRTN